MRIQRLTRTGLATVVVLVGGLLGAPVVLAAAPSVGGEGVSAVGSSAAHLEAGINAGEEAPGKTTECHFEYGKASVTEHKVGCEQGNALTGGEQGVGETVSGLEPGASYHYKIVVKNATGEAEGENQFATVPVPVTDAPENVSGTGATFKGELTLGSAATEYSFAYNDNGECLNGPSTSRVAVTGSTPTVTETATVPTAENPRVGLQPNMKYKVCFVLYNAYGSETGTAVEFTTPPMPPSIDGESTSGVSQSGAVLQAQINPNMQETTYLFEYSPGATLAAPITTVHGQSPLPAGELREFPVNVQITGLAPNTEYSYRAVAENATPLTEDGPTQSFVTFPNTPVTAGASAVTTSTASIAGTVDPSSGGQPAGHQTSYFFQYGNDTAYGKETPIENAGEGATPVTESAALTGLTPNRVYHYRIVARDESSEGSGVLQLSYGQDETFTTASTPPVAVTGAALAVTSNTATITGEVNPQGLQATYELDYNLAGYAGCDPEGENGYRVIFDSNTTQGNTIAAAVSGLQPGNVYHYRTVVTTADGTSCSPAGTFTTQGSPIATPPGVSPALLPSSVPAPVSKPAVVKAKAKALTRGQKLSKALKACRREPKGAKRKACERAAHKRYAPAKRGAKKHKKKP